MQNPVQKCSTSVEYYSNKQHHNRAMPTGLSAQHGLLANPVCRLHCDGSNRPGVRPLWRSCKMWKSRSRSFELCPKVQKFKPPGFSDSQFAESILNKVNQALSSPPFGKQGYTGQCLLLPDCSKAPFLLAKDGSSRRYSAMKIWQQRKSKRKFMAVELHRFILWCKDGAPVGANTDALHNFDCRQGCINPQHLRWGTPEENAADRQRLLAG